MTHAHSPQAAMAYQQYHFLHAVYVLLDDGDRRVLSRYGLTLAQYRVLKSLDTQTGQRLTTLSARLLRAKSTITRIVDQLEAENLVTRMTDAEDRRAQRVVLTPDGEALLEEALTAHEASLTRRLGEALDDNEQAQFHDLLEKLHDSLVQDLYHVNKRSTQPVNHEERRLD